MNPGPAASALFLSAAIGFTSAAQAMELPQFDKMAQNDQAEYISELVSGAEKILTNEGKADQARKVENLFTTNAPDGTTSIGMSQFMLDLAKARLADAQRALKDPHAQRLEVEDVMAVTLQRNGIEMPDSFFSVNSGFTPKSPAPKPSVPDGASSHSASKPMITHNPDGTFTIQKGPPAGNSPDAKATEGLVIPAQVVVPIIPTPEKKP